MEELALRLLGLELPATWRTANWSSIFCRLENLKAAFLPRDGLFQFIHGTLRLEEGRWSSVLSHIEVHIARKVTSPVAWS